MSEDFALHDTFGNLIVLTPERLSHINEHPELLHIVSPIEDTVSLPDAIVRSRSDATVSLFYKRYENTVFGNKYCCVVIKYTERRNFIVTAYLTDKVKEGTILWRK